GDVDLVTTTAIVWFRQDLRLADNPALAAAIRHDHLIPLFIWSPDEDGAWAPGAASRWWLHDSLAALHDELVKLGSGLVIRAADSAAVLQAVAEETGAGAVYWNRRYEPAAVARDKLIKVALKDAGLAV